MAKRLRNSGYDASEVSVVWMKLAPDPFSVATADELDAVLATARTVLPNLRQVFVSSRSFGGYADGGEPAAWKSGIEVREFVLRHLGETAPWVGWGPYLWSNGAEPNPAGVAWMPADFESDMIHPSASGEAKVASLLDGFWTDNPLSPWY